MVQEKGSAGTTKGDTKRTRREKNGMSPQKNWDGDHASVIGSREAGENGWGWPPIEGVKTKTDLNKKEKRKTVKTKYTGREKSWWGKERGSTKW